MNYLYLHCDETQSLTPAQTALLSEEKAGRVFIETAGGPDALNDLLAQLSEGDCLIAESFAALTQDGDEFMKLLSDLTARGVDLRCVEENLDTRTEVGQHTREALFSLYPLLFGKDDADPRRAGIQRAREAGKYKGRKPIFIDDKKLDEVAARWRSGLITAKQAMQELGLKPNTFYRRIKAKGEETMKNSDEIKAAAAQIGKEIKEGIGAGAEELKVAAERVIAQAKEAELGKKVKEAAGQVADSVKDAELGKKVKEAAGQVVEAVKDAELGKKVKEGFENTKEAVGMELDLRKEQIKREIEDVKARAEQREQAREDAEENKEDAEENKED